MVAPASRPSSCSSKPGGFAFAPSSMLTSLCVSGAPPASRRSRSTRHACRRDRRRGLRPARSAPPRSRSRCIASCTASSLIAFEARVNAIVLRSPGSNAGTVSNEAVKVSGWPSSIVDVADVGRVDRLEPLLAQRIVDGARDQVVRDVVKDLVLEALLDDARRRLARPEAGDARLARVVARDAVDLGVDHIGGDFDAHGLARLVDVGKFGFHRCACGHAVRYCRSASEAGARCRAEARAGRRAKAGAKGGSRTRMAVNHRILSPARLPIPPLSRLRFESNTGMLLPPAWMSLGRSTFVAIRWRWLRQRVCWPRSPSAAPSACNPAGCPSTKPRRSSSPRIAGARS